MFSNEMMHIILGLNFLFFPWEHIDCSFSLKVNSRQGLSQDFKNACLKLQSQTFCCLLLLIKLLIYFISLYQLYLIAHHVKKCNLHFIHVLEGGVAGFYHVILGVAVCDPLPIWILELAWPFWELSLSLKGPRPNKKPGHFGCCL